MRSRNLIWTTILAASLIAAGSTFGGVEVGPTLIEFTIDGDGGQLAIGGPGNFRLDQTFKGQSVSFSLYDADGAVRPDGIYKYEIAIAGVATGDRADYRDRGEYLSGSFSIADGAFVDPNVPERGVMKDQQILDDLIVQGSICAGFDCVNGESFGFDTLRLKENNLRIRAFDTSTSASFPTRDWQITFNETDNGGLDKFSIDDIDGGRTPFTIEAGARTNALYVEADGNIGVGTKDPVTDIHIRTGNTPTLRLDQDGSSGFAAQVWDLAGNEANLFLRDATNGSTLPFRIYPGAPSNALAIEGSTGDIGVGTNTPAGPIHALRTSAAGRDMLIIENNGPSRILLDNTASTAEWRLNHASDGIFRITDNSDAGAANEFALTTTGNLTLAGTLTITGGCTGCDAVLTPEWELESIEEHAALMWQNSYLPAVGPTPEGTVQIDVFQKTTGILQELEKAHIYIEQLHNSIKELEQRLEAVEGQD